MLENPQSTKKLSLFSVAPSSTCSLSSFRRWFLPLLLGTQVKFLSSGKGFFTTFDPSFHRNECPWSLWCRNEKLKKTDLVGRKLNKKLKKKGSAADGWIICCYNCCWARVWTQFFRTSHKKQDPLTARENWWMTRRSGFHPMTTVLVGGVGFARPNVGYADRWVGEIDFARIFSTTRARKQVTTQN